MGLLYQPLKYDDEDDDYTYDYDDLIVTDEDYDSTGGNNVATYDISYQEQC